MNVEKWISPANCSRAGVRISTSLHTKYRFYESYWLFYCLRIHWFFSLIVFSTDAGRGKVASNWCADSTGIFHKERDPKTDTWQDGAAKDRPWKRCGVRGAARNLLSDSSSLLLGCWEDDTCFSRREVLIFLHRHPFPPSTKAMKENE